MSDESRKEEQKKYDTISLYIPQVKTTPVESPIINTSGGVKHDQGKPDLSHISLELMEVVARVREFGAKKYARNNWRKGFKYTRSIAAALRHIFAFSEGQDLDPESGITHIGHAICCLEHLLNDIKNNPQNDDRKDG